jgi:type II secretory pathway pseudopilin PulG
MMKLKNAEKGISLIALIITIIVIIILAVIVIGGAMNTPESANKAKYLGDLSEVQQAVAIKRAENLMPTINNIEADMNDGFTKITMKRTSTGDTEDGWVVNLNNIGIKNSTLGNGYDEVVENSEIIFGDEAPDVYVYDANGEVYYAKGYKDGNDTIYSQTYTKESEIVSPLSTMKQALIEALQEFGVNITVGFENSSIGDLIRILRPYLIRENKRVGGSTRRATGGAY